MAAIRVVMIIDESLPRRGELKGMLAQARLAVTAESGYGVDAVTLADERKPDVVLVAVDEPVGRAIQTIESIRALGTGAAVIAYSNLTDVAVLRQAMRAGVRDFLTLPLRSAQVLAAIADATGDAAVPQVPGTTDAATPATQPRGAGIVVTVIGAKGGIGKSTIAVNLAAAIARRKDHSVLLVDLDAHFGDTALMLGLEPRYTTAEVAANIGALDRDAFRAALVQHESGLFVLPSVTSIDQWRDLTPDGAREVVRMAARMFDYVIVDTPGAYNELVACAIEIASQVVVVTSFDLASIKDTTFILNVLEREGLPADRLLLAVNHATSANSVQPHEISRVLHKEVDWELPHDPAVALATQLGQPVITTRPKSRAARSFEEMATRLTGTEAVPEGRPGIVGRLFGVRGGARAAGPGKE